MEVQDIKFDNVFSNDLDEEHTFGLMVDDEDDELINIVDSKTLFRENGEEYEFKDITGIDVVDENSLDSVNEEIEIKGNNVTVTINNGTGEESSTVDAPEVPAEEPVTTDDDNKEEVPAEPTADSEDPDEETEEACKKINDEACGKSKV